MKLSVIIPVFNGQRTIRRCIESLCREHFISSLEVIIVDDHSTDNSWMICKKLYKEFKNIILLKNKGKGVSAARNTGLETVTGDIIGFCDADDLYEKNTVDLVIAHFKNYMNTDVLVGSVKTKKRDGLDLFRNKRNKKEFFDSSKSYNLMCLTNRAFMGSVWNKFYNRNTIGDIRFPENISFLEDLYFNILVSTRKKNLNVYTLPNTTYIYNKNKTSVTLNPNRMFDGNKLKYIKTLLKIKKHMDLSKEEIEYINCAVFYVSVDNFEYAIGNSSRMNILKLTVNKYLKYFIKYYKQYGVTRFLTHLYKFFLINTKY